MSRLDTGAAGVLTRALSGWRVLAGRVSPPGIMTPSNPYRGFGIPAEVIQHAVWLYHGFSLSLRNVETILAAGSIVGSYETIRVDAKLTTWHLADESSRRLVKIPGVGPIGAVLLTMKTPEPALFQSRRQFATWIGLTPKDHSPAGKVRRGVITRAGDEG
jgi:hypothetical protein